MKLDDLLLKAICCHFFTASDIFGVNGDSLANCNMNVAEDSSFTRGLRKRKPKCGRKMGRGTKVGGFPHMRCRISQTVIGSRSRPLD